MTTTRTEEIRQLASVTTALERLGEALGDTHANEHVAAAFEALCGAVARTEAAGAPRSNIPAVLTPEEGRAIWDELYGPKGKRLPDGTPRDAAAMLTRARSALSFIAANAAEQRCRETASAALSETVEGDVTPHEMALTFSLEDHLVIDLSTGKRPAVRGGECARCFHAPPAHEPTCPVVEAKIGNRFLRTIAERAPNMSTRQKLDAIAALFRTVTTDPRPYVELHVTTDPEQSNPEVDTIRRLPGSEFRRTVHEATGDRAAWVCERAEILIDGVRFYAQRSCPMTPEERAALPAPEPQS